MMSLNFELELDFLWNRMSRRIRAIIAERNQRYQSRGGEVRFAGIEGNTVKIAPLGFCWR